MPWHSRSAARRREAWSDCCCPGIYIGRSSSAPERRIVLAPLSSAALRLTASARSDDDPRRGVPPIPTMRGLSWIILFSAVVLWRRFLRDLLMPVGDAAV